MFKKFIVGASFCLCALGFFKIYSFPLPNKITASLLALTVQAVLGKNISSSRFTQTFYNHSNEQMPSHSFVLLAAFVALWLPLFFFPP